MLANRCLCLRCNRPLILNNNFGWKLMSSAQFAFQLVDICMWWLYIIVLDVHLGRKLLALLSSLKGLALFLWFLPRSLQRIGCVSCQTVNWKAQWLFLNTNRALTICLWTRLVLRSFIHAHKNTHLLPFILVLRPVLQRLCRVRALHARASLLSQFLLGDLQLGAGVGCDQLTFLLIFH